MRRLAQGLTRPLVQTPDFHLRCHQSRAMHFSLDAQHQFRG